MTFLKYLPVIALATTLNVGCGGGGGGSTASPNGIYIGNITGGEPSFNGIEEKGIIYNGRFMTLSNQANGISQLFDASLTITNTSLSGSGFRYDSSSLRNSIGYDGTFIEKQSTAINFIATGSNLNNFPAGAFNLTYSSSILAKGADTSRLQGSWSGIFDSGFGSIMDLNFDTNGSITSGSDQAPLDCTFTGNITPADSSINVYNASITSSGGSQCTMPAGTYTGLAWTEGDTDGTLVLMIANGTLKGGRAVILTKN